MLKIKNLEVSYERVQVIWGVDLSVQKNEAVGIFGPNGSGKTTIIKSILGLVDNVSGEIEFEDRNINKWGTHEIIRSGVALVPQDRELFPRMTVEENLRLGSSFIERAQESTSENLTFVFDLFPSLKEKREDAAGTLSGGQQRMLTVGRALMADPDLLILDEPSVGLQPSLVKELFQKLKNIKAEGEVSIFLAEQNVRQGLKIIDRGYVLENGSIVIEADGDELLDNEHVQEAYLGL